MPQRPFHRPTLARLATFMLAFLLAVLLSACGDSVELLSNMTEREANEVIAVLADADIKASKIPAKDGAVNVQVDQAQVPRAITVLSAEGMPRERRATMGDVFRKEGLISSPLEERARYLWALSQELSETISQIDGVLRARVHVVLPERSTGGEPPLPSSAGVFVKHRRTVNMEDSVPAIKRLVASSIPGLTTEKVSVVLVASGAPAQPHGAKAARNGASGWLIVAYVLMGLSVACVVALGAWRFLSMRRGRRGDESAAGGAIATGAAPESA